MKKNALHPYSSENTHPGFSLNCAVFTLHEGKIKVLLGKPEFMIDDYWMLPGGFMFKEESADEAAWRELEGFSGLSNIYMKQFYLFSDPKRTIIEQNAGILKKNEMPEEAENKWFLQRFLSLGYYGLVRYNEAQKALRPAKDMKLKWYNVKELPPLYTDHENIVKTALDTIRALLPVIPLCYELLPEKFTMYELRKIYENILDRSFDRRNFQRKILLEGNIIQLDERKKGNAYNAPILYTFEKTANKNITSIWGEGTKDE